MSRQSEVLDILIDQFHGRASAQAVGQALGLPRAVATRYLTDLVKLGWAERTWGRNRLIFTATRDGRTAYDIQEELAQ